MTLKTSRFIIPAAVAVLLTTAGSNLLARDAGNAVSKQAKNWYIRLTAEAPEHGLKDQNSKLGQLSRKDAAAEYSLSALTPVDSNYLYIAFDDPQGVEESGEYKSSFHRRWKETRREDSWDFTVKSSDPQNDIILSWSGLYVLEPYEVEDHTRYTDHRELGHRLTRRMKLIDRQTLEEVPMVFKNDLQQYSFNMAGATERDFTWVLDSRRVSVSGYSSAQMKAATVEVRRNTEHGDTKMAVMKIQQQAFDLSRPPRTLNMD